MKNIVLIGMMGTSKTTVGKRLAAALRREFFDSDEIYEQRFGKISQTFAESGEDVFRERETLILKELALKTDAVISCGGGAALKEENMKAISSFGIILWLTASPEEIYARIGGKEGRPLLSGKNIEEIRKMSEMRSPCYKKYAAYTFNTGGQSVERNAAYILSVLRKAGELS